MDQNQVIPIGGVVPDSSIVPIGGVVPDHVDEIAATRPDGAVSRFGTQLWDRLKDNAVGIGGLLKRVVTDPTGPSNGLGGVIVDAVKGAAAPLASMPEAGRLLMKGQFGKATGQAMESLPIVGPSIQRADDLERSGDLAGALGSLTGDAIPFAVTDGAGRLAGAGADAAEAVVKGGARRLWNLSSGNTDPAIADAILSRGRGTLRRANTDALRREATAGDAPVTPAKPQVNTYWPDEKDPVITPSVQEQPATKSPLWPAVAAHESGAMPSVASHFIKSSVGGAVGSAIGHGQTAALIGAAAAESAPMVASAAAQAAHSLPVASILKTGPDAARAASMALLAGQASAGTAPQPMASHDAAPIAPMASHDQIDRSRWDKRADGSLKGDGFLGVLQRPEGGVSSEISIGTTDVNGKEMDIPLLVPTLTPDEVSTLLSSDLSKPSTIPRGIVQKAVAFARQRVAAGKPVFAQAGESK